MYITRSRTLALVTALALSASLTACGSKGGDTTKPDPTPAVSNKPTGGPVGATTQETEIESFAVTASVGQALALGTPVAQALRDALKDSGATVSDSLQVQSGDTCLVPDVEPGSLGGWRSVPGSCESATPPTAAELINWEAALQARAYDQLIQTVAKEFGGAPYGQYVPGENDFGTLTDAGDGRRFTFAMRSGTKLCVTPSSSATSTDFAVTAGGCK